LPEMEADYLILFEKEVLITVFVELPHSKYSMFKKGEFISAKGLAGHSAMAIGERYFDYGPDYSQTIVNEKKYNYDFNEDGDTDDNVDLTERDKQDKPIYTINEEFSPGMPWWGTHIAKRKKIKPEEVTLYMVVEYKKLHWRGRYDSVLNDYPDATYIYGTVNQIEFYVKESESKKMILWWEERYKHLKVYSVFPWTGEQCTTTVKTAIQEAFPVSFTTNAINIISDDTQKPSGLLSELNKFVSTSRKHKNENAIITILKKESVDFK
jgi:hypothetical protein